MISHTGTWYHVFSCRQNTEDCWIRKKKKRGKKRNVLQISHNLKKMPVLERFCKWVQDEVYVLHPNKNPRKCEFIITVVAYWCPFTAMYLRRTDPSENVSYFTGSNRDKQLVKGLRLLLTCQYFQNLGPAQRQSDKHWKLFPPLIECIFFIIWGRILFLAFLCSADIEILCHTFQGLDRLKPCSNFLVDKSSHKQPAVEICSPEKQELKA